MQFFLVLKGEQSWDGEVAHEREVLVIVTTSPSAPEDGAGKDGILS